MKESDTHAERSLWQFYVNQLGDYAKIQIREKDHLD